MKLALIALSAAWAAFGQPAFEAASIKPNTSARDGHDSDSTPGAMTIHNFTLRMLVVQAYGIKDYQVSGGAKWVNTDRYDVSAKAAGPAEDAQLNEMLQTLLAERFQLVVHKESKPFPGFALLVDKKGLKMKPVEDTGKSSSNSRGGPITFKGMSMARLATWTSRRLSAPVVDETGVEGVFDFTLDWTPFVVSAPGDASDPFPSLFSAFSEQLGVKVERRKVPLDVIVIDRAEKATAN
jgi:uncharacterized protein (TIGR03435 family)